MRIAARLAPVGASILIAGVLAAPSFAAQSNTFLVNCTNVQIQAQWNPPITLTPQPATLTGTLSGGSCSGTVNGAPFSNRPMTGFATIPGVHSCELGEGQGHGAFNIAGRNLYASVTYRRGGHEHVLGQLPRHPDPRAVGSTDHGSAACGGPDRNARRRLVLGDGER
jgi:hypothetical protein